MNLLQTLYIDKSKDLFRDSFGWAAPEYHLMGWALSCLQLHKVYGNITLFANSQAADLLIDKLQLPYTEVNLAHNKLTLIHPNLWALPKIYTYSLQEHPFLHIDGDVFLFEPFNPNLFEGIVEDRGYRYMSDFQDVPFNRSYLHLLGHFKRDEFTCIQMAEKIKKLYPDYYLDLKANEGQYYNLVVYE